MRHNPWFKHGLLPHNALPLKNSELRQNKTWSRVTNELITFQDKKSSKKFAKKVSGECQNMTN